MRHIRALLTLLCFLFASLSSGRIGAAVLCISPDGHIAIESSDGKCCEDEEAAPADRSSESGLALGSSCCNCTDIPLLAPPDLLPSPKSDDAQGVLVHAPLAACAAVWTPGPITRVLAPERIVGEPSAGTLARLSTVVLRC